MTDAAPDPDRDAGDRRDADGADRFAPTGARAPTSPPPVIAYDVPADVDAAVCGECGRPFPDADLLALHRGLDHAGSIEGADRETVERARAAESRRLRLFRLRALVGLVVLYFGLLMVYAVVT